MKNIRTFEEFVNESYDINDNDAEMISENLQLNESAVVGAAILISQIALLNMLLAQAGVSSPVSDWVDSKINAIKGKIRRYKKKKMTEKTYAEFAEKIPQIYSELEKHWASEVKRLKGELESAIAAKENFDGDKRTKEWSSVKYRPGAL